MNFNLCHYTGHRKSKISYGNDHLIHILEITELENINENKI